MGLPKFVDRFVVTQIFNDAGYENIDVESIEITIDEKKSYKKVKLKILESFFTTFNYKDIDILIVDRVSFNGGVKNRKCLFVEFSDYKQIYDRNISINMAGVFSIIEISFDIIDFEIYQDEDLPTIESFVRDYKIKKITDKN